LSKISQNAQRPTIARLAPASEGAANDAGFLITSNAASPVIVHVPHAGLLWPDDSTAIPDYPRLASEITLLADLGIDKIADIIDTLLAETGDPIPNRFQSRLTRVAMDPERLDNDTEEMNQAGMGVVYTHTHTGKPLYSTGLPVTDAARRKSLWYEPYSQALATLVDNAVARHGQCLILDLHSYSLKPLAHELHKRNARPEICLGYEPYQDPGIEMVEQAFAHHGYITARNQPYQGSYVPLARWRHDSNVASLMVEIRKDQYLDQSKIHHGKVIRLAAAVADLIRPWRGITTQ